MPYTSEALPIDMALWLPLWLPGASGTACWITYSGGGGEAGSKVRGEGAIADRHGTLAAALAARGLWHCLLDHLFKGGAEAGIRVRGE